jgi:D-glycero-beta-D-manno-heptose-7-phosphate kinase
MKTDTVRLLEIAGRLAGHRIAVWGDFILDEYIYGTTRRISREAPVLILSYSDREFTLGGAGNALQNIKALGAQPVPVGAVGRDDAGRKILAMLKKMGIASDHMLQVPGYATPLKTRVLAGEHNTRKQQILRIDRESRIPAAADIKKSFSSALRDLVRNCDGLLVSDYNYGAVDPEIFKSASPIFRGKQRPVTLDSRFRILDFPGGTTATPNETEVRDALQRDIREEDPTLRKAGRDLLRRLRSPALLITRGARGMILFETGRPPYLIPAHGSSDIVDVTGAGDTVISVYTLALAAGASFREAAQLANRAGSVVVMKKGAAVLSDEELRQAILS